LEYVKADSVWFVALLSCHYALNVQMKKVMKMTNSKGFFLDFSSIFPGKIERFFQRENLCLCWSFLMGYFSKFIINKNTIFSLMAPGLNAMLTNSALRFGTNPMHFLTLLTTSVGLTTLNNCFFTNEACLALGNLALFVSSLGIGNFLYRNVISKIKMPDISSVAQKVKNCFWNFKRKVFG
jgi:hypothetical protein